MRHLPQLFENNRAWAARMTAQHPSFFEELTGVQRPKYLWIGCADSRVPANQIVGLLPGELFVHRNVANVVVHTDLNCLSVLQFAVDVLGVEHVIVCGHYGCGGVEAAYRRTPVGLVNNWLRHIEDVADRHEGRLAEAGDEAAGIDRLCELNAIEAAVNVSRTTIVQDAWGRGQSLVVHAWIYALGDGLLQDLGFTVSGADEVEDAYRTALGGT